MFDNLLEEALTQEIIPELALQIFEESANPENALKLFEAASRIRDENLDQDLWWSAGISGIFPCKVTPRCGYCTYYTDSFFPIEDILQAVKEIEQMGVRQLHLSGGTCLEGYDQELIDMVERIRNISKIDIEVNLGPSLTQETLKVLKNLGVISVTSSLEVCNDELFKQIKPGDSLEKRKKLMDFCEKEGMPVRSMMLVGVGETSLDRIQHLFYLRKFKRLYHVRFSRFYPYPGTACSNLPRCSPWDLARTIAVARLILPQMQLGLAAGNNSDDIPLWFLAGGGNQILGVTASRKLPHPNPGQVINRLSDSLYIVDKRPLIEHYVNGLGRRIVNECPDY